MESDKRRGWRKHFYLQYWSAFHRWVRPGPDCRMRSSMDSIRGSHWSFALAPIYWCFRWCTSSCGTLINAYGATGRTDAWVWRSHVVRIPGPEPWFENTGSGDWCCSWWSHCRWPVHMSVPYPHISSKYHNERHSLPLVSVCSCHVFWLQPGRIWRWRGLSCCRNFFIFSSSGRISSHQECTQFRPSWYQNT